MKIRIVLTAIFCIILSAAAVSAQDKTTNFAGNWTLDTAKSKLPERMRIESMTMNVTQTDKNLTVETKTKRAERPEGGRRGGGNGGGMGRGGGGMGGGSMMGGDINLTYTLDGKETMADEFAVKAKFEKTSKLKLIHTRSFDTQMGAISIKVVDTWELLDAGKTLKIKRDIETPRGVQSSEMFFTKK